MRNNNYSWLYFDHAFSPFSYSRLVSFSGFERAEFRSDFHFLIFFFFFFKQTSIGSFTIRFTSVSPSFFRVAIYRIHLWLCLMPPEKT